VSVLPFAAHPDLINGNLREPGWFRCRKLAEIRPQVRAALDPDRYSVPAVSAEVAPHVGLARVLPCSAPTVLRYEPLEPMPNEVAFVQDSFGFDGKVLKTTGAIRALDRRKACVVLGAQPALSVLAAP